jgi:hypothetical protein
MSLGAANHFERHKIFSDVFERQLPPVQNEKSGNTLVLSEVQSTYDQTPLAQLGENPDTARTYDYMTPTNTWYGLSSVLDDAFNDDEPADLGEEGLLLWTATRHVLVNVFNVGVSSRVLPLKRVPEMSGYRKGGIEKGYRYKGMDATLAVARAPLDSFAKYPVPRWLFDIREARLKELWGDRYDRWMYFSVPSTRRQHAEWTRTFCRVASKPCIAVDDEALIRQLDKRAYWRDTGHVTVPGSQVYTRWFAQRLHQEQVLVRSDKPLKLAPVTKSKVGTKPKPKAVAKKQSSKSKSSAKGKTPSKKSPKRKSPKEQR